MARQIASLLISLNNL